jgi:hypothetical protein
MNTDNSLQSDLSHIKTMMERSSRFISLSGLSGVSAGTVALLGAYISLPYVKGEEDFRIKALDENLNVFTLLFNNYLFWIAAGTFLVALVSAFLFTWRKSKNQGIKMWGLSSKNLMLAVCVPMAAGALLLFRLLSYGTFGLVAPVCLIFYGLGLINASKYTFGEIKILGYLELILGLVSMYFMGYGLYFWALGFGVLHIVYGLYMWFKYEKNAIA